MSAATATVTSGDRLTFTLFVAAVVHAVLLFGLTFTAPRVELPQVMEVTLAQHRSDQNNPDADFLANANQQGSGTLDRAELITSPHQSPFKSSRINEIQPQEQLAAAQRVQEQRRQVLTSTANSPRQHDNRRAEQLKPEQAESRTAQMAQAYQSDEIASLEARLAAKKNAYAKRPKVRTVSTVATRYDRDALYIDAFRAKVEQIGNQNYPEPARARKLFGNVRLLVAILPNGQVQNITVLKGSGHKILDEAAKRSVYMAAPFQAFPAEIRRDTDILQIIRTWKFAETLTSDA